MFLFLVLLALPDAKLTVGRIVGRDTPGVPRLPATLVRAAIFVPAIGLLATVAGDNILDLNRALIYGTLLLSLVLLTGYSGQISLAQYVFFGLGAFAMAKVAGGDSILGMGAAAAIAVPFGVVVALPALRLQGLYLALVTFALAQVSRDVIFQDSRIYGLGGVTVGRLELFGIDFASDEAFAVLCALVFALVAIGVLALRRGPFGRRLAAMRDSQAACATLGLDVRRTKLTVFALSSAIAGLAGALYGGLGFTAGQLDFEPLYNVLLFLFAFVGGITTVTGALLGGTLFALLPLVQSEKPELAGLVFALIAVVALALGKQPNGMAGMLFGWRTRMSSKPSPAAPPDHPACRQADRQGRRCARLTPAARRSGVGAAAWPCSSRPRRSSASAATSPLVPRTPRLPSPASSCSATTTSRLAASACKPATSSSASCPADHPCSTSVCPRPSPASAPVRPATAWPPSPIRAVSSSTSTP